MEVTEAAQRSYDQGLNQALLARIIAADLLSVLSNYPLGQISIVLGQKKNY